MKSLKWGLVAILMSNVAHAINPLSGWYAGLLVGGSQASDVDFTIVAPVRGVVGPGVLSYSRLGNIGLQGGYRIKNFRLEGEALYNNNSYHELTIGNTIITNSSSNSSGSLGSQINRDLAADLQLQGYTNTYAFMLNGIYDFYIRDYPSHFVPYVGFGVGYMYRASNIAFSFNSETIADSASNEYTNNLAGQGIVGLSYYLSDQTSFSLDFRYLTSTSPNTVYTLRSHFSERPQIYSVNLLFNMAFNLP